MELNPSDDPSHPDSHHHHALEFEYDCDAPKCGIYVDVILSPEQKPDDATSRLTVFESTFEGGFGRLLKLEDGATLELGRFEHRTGASEVSEPSQDVAKPTIPPTIPEQQPTNSTTTSEPAPDARHERKRRFTGIHFRKHTHGGSVSGPALTVMDVEANSPASETTEKAVSESKESEEGVRVLIRLVALDEQGTELSSANEQSTYLHVVRLGAATPSDQDDTRPWVVKVVKREATIGPHTFHLQEIYGLSSSSSHNATPPVPALPSPTLTQTHTYPPIAPPVPTHEDEPSSECLLCLSSPREVVLLPCRHLVACKECAVNMIEFGAGGTITHSESDPASESVPAGGEANAAAEGAADGTDVNVTVTGSEGAANGEPVEGAAPAPAPIAAQPIAPVPQNPRRKRRAKGWFCPVCRQREYQPTLVLSFICRRTDPDVVLLITAYTSLLRITTTPPASSDKYGKRASTSTDGGHPLEFGSSAPAPASPPAAIVESPSSRGFPRPSFLRGLSRNASARAEASPV